MSAAGVSLFSLNQRDADLGARERFTEALSTVRGPDVLVLLTCHRAEVLASEAADPDALASRLGTDLPASGHLRTGRAAALQLLRVVCGLDSAIRGEGQILGQLRRTFDAARPNGLRHDFRAAVALYPGCRAPLSRKTAWTTAIYGPRHRQRWRLTSTSERYWNGWKRRARG